MQVSLFFIAIFIVGGFQLLAIMRLTLTGLHSLASNACMRDVLRDPTDNAELATPIACARRLGVSRRTVYYWIAAGRVQVRYAPNGNVLIEVRSLVTRSRPQITTASATVDGAATSAA